MVQQSRQSPSSNSIYLCAPINALVEGIYEEHIPLAEVKQHGDFGLGTFDHLDGEMVMVDGEAYQITADGRVELVGDEALTPFSAVTFYNPASHHELTASLDNDAFNDWLLGFLPSPNIFYALRLDGLFDRVRTRSVPKVECYVPLVEVTKDQPEFEFENIEGTLAGFFTPEFMSSVSVPGLHLHFLSTDKQHGGHLLACRPRTVQVGIQPIYTLELALPRTAAYLGFDFHRDVAADLEQAEH